MPDTLLRLFGDDVNKFLGGAKFDTPIVPLFLSLPVCASFCRRCRNVLNNGPTYLPSLRWGTKIVRAF